MEVFGGLRSVSSVTDSVQYQFQAPADDRGFRFEANIISRVRSQRPGRPLLHLEPGDRVAAVVVIPPEEEGGNGGPLMQ